MKKDPGIPNLFPYKDRILADIEEKKRLKEEDQLRRKEEAKAAKKTGEDGMEDAAEEDAVGLGDSDELLDEDDDEMDEESGDDGANPMAALLASARARAVEYDEEDEDEDDEMDDDMEVDGGGAAFDPGQAPGGTSRKDTSRRAFDKIFKDVTSAADVILYVLDARDPEGTRSKEVERQIMASEGGSKRLILILNKIDLVPPPVLKAWLLHLRRYFPTLPLRASTPAPNAHTFNHKQLTVKGTSETLFRALKTYAHSKQLKRAISVGVIGYPNVGKSSVINALTSRLGGRGDSRACPVGAEAGVTTALREVKLDNKLKLLDSPGIVFPSSADGKEKTKKSSADEQARLILLNAIPPKQIEDPVPAVSLLLTRLASSSPQLFQKMLDMYGIPQPVGGINGDITTDFLINVARKRGRLGKGGVPNLSSAAMAVVMDWRDGRIQGWVDAPVLQVVGANAVVPPPAAAGAEASTVEGPAPDQKEIVTEWAKEFKIEGLWGDGTNAEEEEMTEA